MQLQAYPSHARLESTPPKIPHLVGAAVVGCMAAATWRVLSSRRRSVFSYRSAWSVLSASSVLSIGSAASVLSIGSFASVLCIGSSNSILSIGSDAGFLSVGKRSSPAT
jgi:hypothetical protein